MIRIIKFIFLFLLILLGITFALLNSTDVTIHYYIGQKNLPVALIIVISLMIGLFLGLLLSLTSTIRCQRLYHRTSKQLKQVQAQVAAHASEAQR